jgi:SAM-dependent methyltransferase
MSGLANEEVLAGYDAVARLYPSIPPILIWRSWEFAAYRRFPLNAPILDVGCGDGRFFKLVFPDADHVVGVDADAGVAHAAIQSGVYRDVHVAAADTLPLIGLGQTFGSAFANCSLEHMDRLQAVLEGVCASLRPGGTFLFSVVTDKFVEWAPLPLLLRAAGAGDRARKVQEEYEAFHHLVNPLPAGEWRRRAEAAGFDIIDHVPIVPEWTARLFLFLDQLWHQKAGDGECGGPLESIVAARRSFTSGFRGVLAGVLAMEEDPGAGAGAVFYARRRS